MSMMTGFALMITIDILMNMKRELQREDVRINTTAPIGEENIQDKYFSVDDNNYYSQFIVDESAEHGHSHNHFDKNKSPIVTTLGLVVHSISDGVALGCSIYCKSYHFNFVFDLFILTVNFIF